MQNPQGGETIGLSIASEVVSIMFAALENCAALQGHHVMVLAEAGKISVSSVADDLCDDLMIHTFECDACINGLEETCPVFCALNKQIAAAGGPTKSALLSV